MQQANASSPKIRFFPENHYGGRARGIAWILFLFAFTPLTLHHLTLPYFNCEGRLRHVTFPFCHKIRLIKQQDAIFVITGCCLYAEEYHFL